MLLPKLKWDDREKQLYQRKISHKTELNLWTEDVETDTKSLLEIIYACSRRHCSFDGNKFKQKWFDSECQEVRTKVMKLLRLFRRTNSVEIGRQYREQKMLFFTSCMHMACQPGCEGDKESVSGPSAAVWTQKGLSQYFETKSGLKQGCLLSPILFSLFMDDIEESMEDGATQKLCSLCNMRVEEDVYHFIAVCPVLKEIKRECFWKRNPKKRPAGTTLNGEDWLTVTRYCRLAWRYRHELVMEFNY
ncbi:hypothetical protein LSTR_LSTR004089 [Laodelphax striatellus]|uniref:Uncharacterized protein n=1 Tax=Laodelphax striatellus TaxID=195883 RepID=A0A482WHJ9_LAOST|nr:hypothetical protein LSTR_LSTR004089 [Laodelphax striatellus]